MRGSAGKAQVTLELWRNASIGAASTDGDLGWFFADLARLLATKDTAAGLRAVQLIHECALEGPRAVRPTRPTIWCVDARLHTHTRGGTRGGCVAAVSLWGSAPSGIRSLTSFGRSSRRRRKRVRPRSRTAQAWGGVRSGR